MLCWAHRSHSWNNCRLLCCRKTRTIPQHQAFKKKFKVSNTRALSLTPWARAHNTLAGKLSSVQPFHKRSEHWALPPILLLLWWRNRIRLSFDANCPLRVWSEPRKIRVYLKVLPRPPRLGSRSPGATINVSALSVATTPPCHLHLYQSQTWKWCLVFEDVWNRDYNTLLRPTWDTCPLNQRSLQKAA